MQNDLLKLNPPELLAGDHQLDGFECTSHPDLSDWLKKKARQNDARGGSRCYVVATAERVVVGYYCLAAGSVMHEEAPKKLRRNMPQPIPVILLGRLATDTRWERHGIGTGLLNHAIDRVQAAAQGIGIGAMLCHAIDERAKRFYLKAGFLESPIHKLTLLLPIRAIVESAK